MLLTLSTKWTRVLVASTVKVAEPVAEVSTAGTTSAPESSAVKVVATVERVVAVVEVELTVAVVGTLVVGGLVVVVVTLAAQPEKSSRTARTGMNTRVFFTASTSSKDILSGIHLQPGVLLRGIGRQDAC
jgi:hypothetical protein